MRARLILILLIFCIVRGNAQEVFSFTFRETPVEEVLEKIEQQTGYIFSYSPSQATKSNKMIIKTNN